MTAEMREILLRCFVSAGLVSGITAFATLQAYGPGWASAWSSGVAAGLAFFVKFAEMWMQQRKPERMAVTTCVSFMI